MGSAVLAARLVEIEVEPAPEHLKVSGLQLGMGRFRLLLSGSHTVRAEKTGFRPLETSFEVTRDARQVARFRMEPLPTLVSLEVLPAEGVRVSVDGVDAGVTPRPPLELAAGSHEVVLQAAGYAAFGTTLTVAGGGDTQLLRATLASDRASISFASAPAGAAVRVDGMALGPTPTSADLGAGARRVEVSLAGYHSATRTLAVEAGQSQEVRFDLEALPGRLQVTSEPPGAAITVDGAFRGESPLQVEIPAGRNVLVKATKAGHASAEAVVTIGRGETLPVALRLTAEMGEVQVEADPPDATVLVDGQPQGRAGQTLRLSAAPHDLEVRRDGYEPHRARLTPRPGFPQMLRVRLKSEKEAAAVARPPVIRPAGGHELRLLEGGRFQMGASRREPGRRANETLREVELVRPSYLGVREVTNAQFRRFKPDHSSGRFGPHDLGGDALPVVQVTWEDAALYCNWLSAQEGKPPAYAVEGGKPVGANPLGAGYRLPTEAEWSRAARYPGPGPLKYPWGPSLPAPAKAGNFADESARNLVPVLLQGYDDGYPVSAPAGSFPPNALGMFDLGGNVAEWVHDVYAIPPAEGPVERDPAGPSAGELHVILGSSFLHGSVSELRLSYRDYGTKMRADVGFRIARYSE
jgi:formylglycine-generating enzyme required for sulfatase activity